MEPAQILFGALAVAVLASVVAGFLPYVGRGGVLSRLRVAAALAGAGALVSAFLALAFAAGVLAFLGLPGWAAPAAAAGVLALSYLLGPLVFSAGTVDAARAGYGWLVEEAGRVFNGLGVGGVRVRVKPDPVPNAFASSNAFYRVVVVHSGLLEALSREEVRAVLAHEAAHIKARDSDVMTALQAPLVVAYWLGRQLALLPLRLLVAAGAAARAAWSLEWSLLAWAAGVIGFFALLVYVGVPGLVLLAVVAAASLAHLALSRVREHLADARAAAYTGDDSIIRALYRIEEWVSRHAPGATKAWRRGLAPGLLRHLYLYPALSPPALLRDLLATHPSLEARERIVEAVLAELGARRPAPT